VDLDLFFGELRVGDLLAVRVEIALERLDAGVPQLLPERGVRERRVQVAADERRGR
jgi:hypothetical protein